MTENDGKYQPEEMSRRQFFRQFFPAVTESLLANRTKESRIAQVETDKGKTFLPEIFIWTNLETGQVGFPTGLNYPLTLPGSILLYSAAAAVVEEGLWDCSQVIHCNGQAKVGRTTISCSLAHGALDLARALSIASGLAFTSTAFMSTNICQTFWAKVAQSLSPDLFLHYCIKFGLDRPAAGMPTGLFPKDLHRRNFFQRFNDQKTLIQANDLTLAYMLGQSSDLKPSPLQLLRFIALVARKGQTKVLHSAEKLPALTEEIKISLKASTWRFLQDVLESVSGSGPIKEINDSCEENMQMTACLSHFQEGSLCGSWLFGYFPRNKPSYAICMRTNYDTECSGISALAQKYLLGVEWF